MVTTEIRPDLAAYRKRVLARVAIATPFLGLVIVLVSSSNASATVLLLVVLVTVALTVGLIAAHTFSTRVVLTPTTVARRSLVVRDVVIEVAHARGVLGVMTEAMSPPPLTLLVQSRRTGQSFHLFGVLWTDEQLAAIAEHVGATVLDQDTPAKELDAHVPGAVPLYYRRPVLVGVGGTLVGIAVLIAAIVWWFQATGRPFG